MPIFKYKFAYMLRNTSFRPTPYCIWIIWVLVLQLVHRAIRANQIVIKCFRVGKVLLIESPESIPAFLILEVIPGCSNGI